MATPGYHIWATPLIHNWQRYREKVFQEKISEQKDDRPDLAMLEWVGRRHTPCM